MTIFTDMALLAGSLKMVSLLLSALIKRVSVSRVRDFSLCVCISYIDALKDEIWDAKSELLRRNHSGAGNKVL